jgi:hypothetical protein
MPHAYTEDQRVEQPAIGLFAELGWQTVSALEEISGATGTLRDKHFANVAGCNEIWIVSLRAICEKRERAFRMQNSLKRSAFHTPPSTVLNGASTTLH